MLLMGRHAICQLITNGALKVILGPGPGIALIAQIALGNHQKTFIPLPIAAYDRTQQRRNIRVAGGRQVSPHFQLGVHPHAHLANQLEHQ